MNIEHQKIGNLFSSTEDNYSEFTEEEIQDIFRYANEHGIHGEARAQLFKWFRDQRADHTVQKPESETK